MSDDETRLRLHILLTLGAKRLDDIQKGQRGPVAATPPWPEDVRGAREESAEDQEP